MEEGERERIRGRSVGEGLKWTEIRGVKKKEGDKRGQRK